MQEPTNFNYAYATMIKCLIVDDEPLARHVLQRYVSQTDNLDLINTCENALEAFAYVGKCQIDLLFLDIRLPTMTGIDFIRTLKRPPAVIFTTAYAEYAVKSYEVDAVDYLLKPITYERFQKSVAKFQRVSIQDEPPVTHTYFKVNGRLVRIEHADIVFAQSIKDYILLRTTAANYITHMTMKYLTDLLPGTSFRRVHRSFLVNRSRVTSVGRYEIEIGGFTVPVGENYRVAIDDFFT